MNSLFSCILLLLSFPLCRSVACLFGSCDSGVLWVHLQELCSVFSRPWRQFGGNGERAERTGHRCHLQVQTQFDPSADVSSPRSSCFWVQVGPASTGPARADRQDPYSQRVSTSLSLKVNQNVSEGDSE